MTPLCTYIHSFLFYSFPWWFIRASLIALLVRHVPAMQETPVWFLGLGRSPGAGRGFYIHILYAIIYETDVIHLIDGAPPVAQTVKNLPTIWETWVPSLAWEDPLEEEMATHSSILSLYIAYINFIYIKQYLHYYVTNIYLILIYQYIVTIYLCNNM